jgi:hypothetical protein
VKIVFWTTLSLIIAGFSWATVRLALSLRGKDWKQKSLWFVLGFAGLSIAFVICIAVLLLAAFWYSGSRTMPTVYSPSHKHDATVSSFDGGATEPWHTKVDSDIGVVYRTEEAPDLIRLRWDGDDHLVISTPIWPQDVGKPIHYDDPEYFCSPGNDRIRVTCETYPSSLIPAK